MDSVELIQKLEQLKSGLQAHLDTQLKPLLDWQKSKDEADGKNQIFIDEMAKAKKFSGNGNIYTGANKTFSEVFATEMGKAYNQKQAELAELQRSKDAKFSFSLKVMTLDSLTGDPVQTYNPRINTTPQARINFRDLISVTPSATGQYVSYSESGGTGEFAEQVENTDKSELTYEFTEVKNVSTYVAGWARFSKQLLHNLPWLQTTLQRMLLRDFYKAENALFYAQVAGDAAGFGTSTETDATLKIIDYISGRGDADYASSFGIIKPSDLGTILKGLYNAGTLQNIVTTGADGTVIVGGVRLVPASWATAGKIMLIDSDFLERVETEGLRFELSYEDGDNFRKNLISARLETFEDLNLLRNDSATYGDL